MTCNTADSDDLLGADVSLWHKVPWIWPHLLSLDAPAVAVLWQLLFIKVLHAPVAPIATEVMALVIWLIYVGDRILDSYQTGENAREPLRHRFYRAYRKAFLPPFFAVLLLTVWASYVDLGLRMKRDGFLLALAVVAYLFVVHVLSNAREWFPKEMAVAVLFGTGTLLPVAVRDRQIHFSFLLPILLFILLLWMNTLLIEYSEWLTLRKRNEDRPHASTILLGSHLGAFGTGTGILALSAMVVGAFAPARPILMADALSAFALGALGLYWRRIPASAVGVAADVALLAPLLVLPFHW